MKKCILIVDDDPTSLRTVDGMLTAAGYDVRTSTHADNIEQKVREVNPSLIVMDLIMPNTDGNQAVKKLKNNPALKGIPVIFLTALKMRDEDRGIDFEVHVDNVSYRTLTKPVDAKSLTLEIEKLIK
jgi:CheY-like chemotaxis protein